MRLLEHPLWMHLIVACAGMLGMAAGMLFGVRLGSGLLAVMTALNAGALAALVAASAVDGVVRRLGGRRRHDAG